jgi:hypothetical protein
VAFFVRNLTAGGDRFRICPIEVGALQPHFGRFAGGPKSVIFLVSRTLFSTSAQVGPLSPVRIYDKSLAGRDLHFRCLFLAFFSAWGIFF